MQELLAELSRQANAAGRFCPLAEQKLVERQQSREALALAGEVSWEHRYPGRRKAVEELMHKGIEQRRGSPFVLR